MNQINNGMKKIKSITEAFSMQPICLLVVTEEKRPKFNPSDAIKNIELECIEIGQECGQPVERLYYVGYNFDGEKKFQYLATSVNVHFY